MFPYPPPPNAAAAGVQPPTTHNDKHGCHRPASALSSSSLAESVVGAAGSAAATDPRFLPSLLATSPYLAAQAQAQVQGFSHLNSLLVQTANLMAVNAQLRKEIEQARGCGAVKGAGADAAAVASLPFLFSAAARPAVTGQPSALDVNAAAVAAASIAPLLPFQHSASAPLLPPHGGGPTAGGGAVTGRMGGGRKSPVPDSYKTVMCQAWLEAATCSFGENCRFAHGEHELRPTTQPQRQNRKYKTKLCDKYTNTGLCPYGARCLFIHPDANNTNAYIRPDKVEELKKMQEDRKRMEKCVKKEGEGDVKVDVKTPLVQLYQNNNNNNNGRQPLGVTPMRPRQTLRPHPSWPLEPSRFFDRDEMTLSSLLPAAAAAAVVAAHHGAQGEGAAPHLNTQQEMLMSEAAAVVQDEVKSALHHTIHPSLAHSTDVSMDDALGSDEGLPLTRNHSPLNYYHTDMASPHATMDFVCPTPGSGCSSGYASADATTPASRATSGTQSPLGGPLSTTCMDDTSVALSSSLQLTLPSISSSVWANPLSDPFAAVLGYDNMSREAMSKIFNVPDIKPLQ